MEILKNIKHERVFKHFEELSKIPRGSRNTAKVSSYCMEFARRNSLKAVRDASDNVIIYKPASKGYESSAPIILQGHLDMVCQKVEDKEIDFEKDGIEIYTDGDFIKAKGTTLGADNGIAVAMIFSILEDETILHPPIEAVFTTDEEIGMLGAMSLSTDGITAKRMINIDSEDAEVVTVSCAGGSDYKMTLPLEREKFDGKCITITIRGLKGGHSGVEINSGRVNANLLMGRLLSFLKGKYNFSIVSIDGGDKGNAIPLTCTAKITALDDFEMLSALNRYAETVKDEICAREEGFYIETEVSTAECEVISASLSEKIINLLLIVPNGVVEMSKEIEGLVETSLNLGILKTEQDRMQFHFTLRSNKKTAHTFLEDKLDAIASLVSCKTEKGGHYPAWEYNNNSEMERIYKQKYFEKFGKEPRVEAIHAGLECGVFASKIDGFDCISIGPEMYDIHTVNERLGIKSTIDIYDIILSVLKELK